MKHREAFCLMKYVDTAGNVEIIWNSRDGVMPLVVTSRHGLEAKHVDWHQDQFTPDHIPQPGDRIFVDLTLEAAKAHAIDYAEQWWNHPKYPLLEVYGTKEEAIEALTKDFFADRHTRPDLIEVGPDGWRNRQ